MEKGELILFIILISVFFGVCILNIIKPSVTINLYSKFLDLFGLKISYNERTLSFFRMLGVILVVFGIIAIMLQFI